MTFRLMYRELWRHLQFLDKIKIISLGFLAVIISVLEVVSISSILPFISIVIGLDTPAVLQKNSFLEELYQAAQRFEDFVLLACFITIIAATAIVRLFTIYLNTTFSFKLGNELCGKILHNTLSEDFEVFSSNQSSHYVNGIFRKTGVLMQNVILGIVQLVGNIIIVTIISAALVKMYGLTTLQIILFIGLIYTLIVFFVAPFTRYASTQAAVQTTKALQVLGEILGSFSAIRINSKKSDVISEYKEIDAQFRKAEAHSYFVAQAPRYLIEALVIVFISTYIVVTVNKVDDTASLVFILTTIVIAMQKLLPYAQQIYSVIIGLKVNKKIFQETIELLKLSPSKSVLQNRKPIVINDSIHLKNLEYARIPNDSPSLALKEAYIRMGTWTVITGETGSGKSTCASVLLGLLQPTSGQILIDGEETQLYGQESWFAKVSFVDQRPFFPNVSIRQMITGASQEASVDEKLLHKVLRTCLLSHTVSLKEDKLEFMIGENANKLSGGQRQRLAIASALYHKKPILILDEATNALDEQTQAELLTNLKKDFPDITVIMIAHRTEIMNFFDNVIELGTG